MLLLRERVLVEEGGPHALVVLDVGLDCAQRAPKHPLPPRNDHEPEQDLHHPREQRLDPAVVRVDGDEREGERERADPRREDDVQVRAVEKVEPEPEPE
eukprot:350923-Rhodomonas_salina.1